MDQLLQPAATTSEDLCTSAKMRRQSFAADRRVVVSGADGRCVGEGVAGSGAGDMRREGSFSGRLRCDGAALPLLSHAAGGGVDGGVLRKIDGVALTGCGLQGVCEAECGVFKTPGGRTFDKAP